MKGYMVVMWTIDRQGTKYFLDKLKAEKLVNDLKSKMQEQQKHIPNGNECPFAEFNSSFQEFLVFPACFEKYSDETNCNIRCNNRILCRDNRGEHLYIEEFDIEE